MSPAVRPKSHIQGQIQSRYSGLVTPHFGWVLHAQWTLRAHRQISAAPDDSSICSEYAEFKGWIEDLAKGGAVKMATPLVPSLLPPSTHWCRQTTGRGWGVGWDLWGLFKVPKGSKHPHFLFHVQRYILSLPLPSSLCSFSCCPRGGEAPEWLLPTLARLCKGWSQLGQTQWQQQWRGGGFSHIAWSPWSRCRSCCCCPSWARSPHSPAEAGRSSSEFSLGLRALGKQPMQVGDRAKVRERGSLPALKTFFLKSLEAPAKWSSLKGGASMPLHPFWIHPYRVPSKSYADMLKSSLVSRIWWGVVATLPLAVWPHLCRYDPISNGKFLLYQWIMGAQVKSSKVILEG